jgi:beta-lactamase regulating signal transducer with metallopeptidase domain/predicted  nucleic acid-binding Zn-ribbon protein
MTPHSVALFSSSLLQHILDPALRSLALGAVAALIIYLFRVKTPAARLAIWKGVLYAALAMPLLALALPTISIPFPEAAVALFANAATASRPPVGSRAASEPIFATVDRLATTDGTFALTQRRSARNSASTGAHARRAAFGIAVVPQADPSVDENAAVVAAPLERVTVATPIHNSLPWLVLAITTFCIVALLLLARIALGAVLAHRLVRSSAAVADCGALRVLMRQARAAGVVSPPRLAESDLVSVPVTLGVLRPAILLPTYWRKWDEATLRAVVAHEISHIARRDALTQRLALVHRAIFWFSPLAWWLTRALADAAEEVSDEAALIAGADRAFYAETLIGFFAALSQNSRRVYWQGVSMAAPGQADRRVDRILNWKGAVSMRISKSLLAGLALIGVPAILLTAAAHPARQAAAPPAPLAPTLEASAPAVPQVTPGPQAMAVPAPAAAPSMPVAANEPMPFLDQAAPTAPIPPSAAGPEPTPPQEPAATPEAPLVVVTPNVGVDGQPTPLELQRLDGTIDMQIKAAQLKSMADVQKQMTFRFAPMAQLSAADRKKLQDLEQRLAELRARYTANRPEVLKLQQDIAALQGQLATNVYRWTAANGPFLYQVGPVTKFSVGNFGDRFVIVSGDSPIIMSGDSQDVEHATGLRGKIDGDFIWFQRDEKSYIIRDQATVNQAKSLFKDEQELGAKQQELGKQIRALGDQMRGMGDKMRDVHVTVPDLSAQMAKLEAQMKQLSAAGGTQQQVNDLQRQMGELMRQLGQTQSQAGDQQRQIGEQMRGLGDQQRTLGDQMRALGDQQRAASEQARQQMKKLLDDALAKGTAQAE